uniref:uncharacterized protein LOC118153683 isoform X2 n=1 Tax=Callithrix jacchus TaxID=9483 RepID=UPI00159DCF34|nr:uncharacterized protein LOC118153683 isoform X2 [Callithrix jacchus]
MDIWCQVWSVLLNIDDIKGKKPSTYQDKEGRGAQGSSLGCLLQMLNDEPNPRKGPQHPGPCWLHLAGTPTARGTVSPLPAQQPGSSGPVGQLPQHGQLVLSHPVLVGLSVKTPTLGALRVCLAWPLLREDPPIPGDS